MDASLLVAGLPAGLTQRPMVAEAKDIDSVTELIVADELAHDGSVEIDREDVETGWARPSFDLVTDTVGIFEDDRLIAEAEVTRSQAEVHVHPGDAGRGIGTALADWTERVARAKGASTLAQTVTDANTAAARLLEARGYGPGHASWILQIENERRPRPVLPDGYAFRTYVDADARTAYRLIEDAFSEWAGREPFAFEDWAPQVVERPSFQPWQLLLVEETATGELVGTAFLLNYDTVDGWIEQVATKAAHRHRGIARGMLLRAFETFWDQGKPLVGLSTDARTGALGLYEKLGMRVIRSYTNRVKPLSRPGSGVTG